MSKPKIDRNLFQLKAETKLKNIREFSNSMKSGIFATKKSPKEAIDFANDVIDCLALSDRTYAYTALHVVLNSVAAELDRLSS